MCQGLLFDRVRERWGRIPEPPGRSVRGLRETDLEIQQRRIDSDALMDGGVAWVAGFDSALLVERDGAEAVEADERGVEGLVWGVGRVLFFGALGSWLGSGHGAAGFGGDEIFAIIFGCLSVDWFVAG